ncbi:right-handed parallel beta-helix repeat-containing protein [Streptococcus sp. zg-JUN1979]|uniref:right-handed parallel beta-helix repeat-containing protein n=1 Tax=Streptococcus sp. zg-JUN1979 TaxID=3391450 RepID=UPI0039A42DF2
MTDNLLDLGFTYDEASAESSNNRLFKELLQNDEQLSICIPAKKRLWLGDVTIERGDITIYGGGSLTANLTFKSNKIKSNVHVRDITFMYDTLKETNCPLIFEKTTRGSIKDCHFKNCYKAISYTSLDSAQHFSRFVIERNYFLGVHYALYGEKSVSGKQPLIAADIHFIDNIVEECFVTHLHLEGFDGGIISNNTFFFPSYMRRPMDKKYNIYIDYCDWTVISNNNLFEAGLDAIHVEHGQHLNITGNNIAWCGQRLGGSGIKILNLDNAGGRFNISTISNNIIMYPTESGIYLDNVGHINMTGNNIFSAGNSGYYYGEKVNLSSLEKWGIYLGSHSTTNLITNNMCAQNAINNLGLKNLLKDNVTADASGNIIQPKYKDIQVSLEKDSRVATIGTGIPKDKLLGATVIYSDDVYYNVVTACINEDGSVTVVSPVASPMKRNYTIRLNLLK